MSKLLKSTSRIRDKQENTYLGFNNNFFGSFCSKFLLAKLGSSSWMDMISMSLCEEYKLTVEVFDKLETTPLCIVVSYAYLVFSQPTACLHQAM